MKLYDGGRAPNPRRVQIFMKEKGIEIPAHQLALNEHEHKTDAMLEKNPFATVPFLELDDGTVIAETVAICRYLESEYPENNLFGTDPLEIAVIEMWSRRMEFYFLQRVGMAFRHLNPGGAVLEGEQIAAWGKKCHDGALRAMKMIDERLGQTRFIAGDRFTIADITAIVAVQFFKPARIAVPEEGFEHFKRWTDEMLQRPSVKM